MKIINNHWTAGGTGLTNFNKKDLPLYRATILIVGDQRLKILKKPFENTLLEGYYSLHFCANQTKDASHFWDTFRKVKELKKNQMPARE